MNEEPKSERPNLVTQNPDGSRVQRVVKEPTPDVPTELHDIKQLVERAYEMEPDRRFPLALGRALAATFRRPYADFPPEAAARLVLDAVSESQDIDPTHAEFLRQNLSAAVLGALHALRQSDWNTTDDPMWFRTQSWDEVANAEPPSWLIEDVLPAGNVSILWGPSGSYKSFVALDIAAHVCQGWAWAGHACAEPWTEFEVARARHRVLYVFGEGNPTARVAAWSALHHHPDFGDDFDFILHPVNLLESETVWNLAESANHRRYALIVIDTLARSIPGADEKLGPGNGQAVGRRSRHCPFLGCFGIAHPPHR